MDSGAEPAEGERGDEGKAAGGVDEYCCYPCQREPARRMKKSVMRKAHSPWRGCRKTVSPTKFLLLLPDDPIPKSQKKRKSTRWQPNNHLMPFPLCAR